MSDDLLYGVALPVPEPHGSFLQDQRAAVGDPQAAHVPTHITLLPPGRVPQQGLDALTEQIAAVFEEARAFEIELNGTDTFRPISPVTFVVVQRGGEQTAQLANDVRAAAQAPEPDFEFHPHVTIAQHLDDAALDAAQERLADFSCTFTAERVGLYLFDDTAGWTPYRTFALSA